LLAVIKIKHAEKQRAIENLRDWDVEKKGGNFMKTIFNLLISMGSVSWLVCGLHSAVPIKGTSQAAVAVIVSAPTKKVVIAKPAVPIAGVTYALGKLFELINTM
jgi:hypothetical protein